MVVHLFSRLVVPHVADKAGGTAATLGRANHNEQSNELIEIIRQSLSSGDGTRSAAARTCDGRSNAVDNPYVAWLDCVRALTPTKFETLQNFMTALANHPERNVIRLELAQNAVLQDLGDADRADLEPHLDIVEGHKGEFLLRQGVREMEQYFILQGILKRVVANAEGKEMILRFADEGDMETSYAAWRLGTPIPYSIVCVTKVRVARMPLKTWAAFLENRAAAKHAFEFFVMRVMSEIMAHTITLHLLDAPGRVQRFLRKHPALAERIPQKELASYMNLSAETLSRLRQSGKI